MTDHYYHNYVRELYRAESAIQQAISDLSASDDHSLKSIRLMRLLEANKLIQDLVVTS